VEFEDWAALMQDTPAADNHGRRRRTIQDETDSQSHDSLETNYLVGDHVLDTVTFVSRWDRKYYGITPDKHRPVPESDMHLVDWEQVRDGIAEELGVPWAEIEAIYCRPGGRPDKAFVARRAPLDEALLRVRESGGNTRVIAQALGWPFLRNGKCEKMTQALRRARAARTGNAGSQEDSSG
jgi:hypothetical protein